MRLVDSSGHNIQKTFRSQKWLIATISRPRNALINIDSLSNPVCKNKEKLEKKFEIIYGNEKVPSMSDRLDKIMCLCTYWSYSWHNDAIASD